jgi:predicted transglutaminase-like cysteine proteinase
MRRFARFTSCVAIIAFAASTSISHAAFFSFPKGLKSQLERLSLDAPALAPMAHARFCLQYPEDCTPEADDFRRRNIALTANRWNELSAVNRAVNGSIAPRRDLGGLSAERWLVAPAAGSCHDFAVTKRHELLERGWPARSLLLSEVITASDEHHLVLVVRMKDIDLVLDNLSAEIRPVGMTSYKWVRVESPHNPRYWSTASLPAHVQEPRAPSGLSLGHPTLTLGDGEPENRAGHDRDGGAQRAWVHE